MPDDPTAGDGIARPPGSSTAAEARAASSPDLEALLARLEHAVGRVRDEAAEPDARADAAEHAAQVAGEGAAELDRLVRESGATGAAAASPPGGRSPGADDAGRRPGAP